MNGDDRYVSERQNLLTRLLDAVKQCQVRFGGRTELATDGDSRISCLCAAWEAALQHGMKHTNKALSTLKQVTAITGLTKVTGIGILDDIKNMETEPVFWHFVKEHLGKHELPRFQILKAINTDSGRGRAWLRSTLNEHSLEKYMHVLLENDTLLCQYYEDWAFVRDQERSSMLPMMAAGLGSILFAINIDNEELNTIKAATGLDSLMPAAPPATKAFAARVEDEPRPVIAGEVSPTHSQEKKKEKKKRKKMVNIVSFDEDEPSSYSTSPSSSVTSPQSITSGVDLGSILPVVTTSAPSSAVTSPHNSTLAFDEDTVQAIVSSDKTSMAEVDPSDKVETTVACPVGETSDNVVDADVKERAGTITGDQDLNTISEGFAELLAAYPTNAAPLELSDVISVPSGGNEQSSEIASIKSQQSTDSDSKSETVMSDSGVSKVYQNHIVDNSKSLPVRRVHSLINMPRCSSDTSATSMEIEASIYSVETNGPAEILTPLTPDGKPIGGMMVPIYPSANGDIGSGVYGTSVDSSELPLSFGADTENAAFALSMAQKGLVDSQGLRTQGDGSNTPEPVSFKHDSMSTDELKQAVVAMMLRKDEVEEHNKSLRALVESEQETTAALRVEIEALKKDNTVRQDKDADRIQALTRENELLKHQLKKYVNAVQMLRRKNNADAEELHGIHLDEVQPAIPPSKPNVDYSLEASEYERKLIQVAEMHGELMEFNEMLHRQLHSRETQLQRMRQELIDLRGPLPADIQSEDSASVSSDFDSYGSSRPLINVWIPSAFLRGTSSDAYHVYQIYVRIRDEEWNVYRRYAEFYVLHSKLKKNNPIVNTFEFPPKKSFGNRDPKFVEVRRKKLQSYIRRVLNLLVLNHPDLGSCASRERLLEAMPFFGDQPLPDKKSKAKVKGRRRSAGGNSGATTSSPPAEDGEHYMGL